MGVKNFQVPFPRNGGKSPLRFATPDWDSRVPILKWPYENRLWLATYFWLISQAPLPRPKYTWDLLPLWGTPRLLPESFRCEFTIPLSCFLHWKVLFHVTNSQGYFNKKTQSTFLRSHPHTPGRYPGRFTNSLWRNSFFLGVWGSLGYLPRVCGQNHWTFCPKKGVST